MIGVKKGDDEIFLFITDCPAMIYSNSAKKKRYLFHNKKTKLFNGTDQK